MFIAAMLINPLYATLEYAEKAFNIVCRDLTATVFAFRVVYESQPLSRYGIRQRRVGEGCFVFVFCAIDQGIADEEGFAEF